MGQPTAIVYARVSSAGQAEEELPIESQIEMCVARAEQLGASVVSIFRDDGISGRTGRRQAFQEAIDYCLVRDVNYFILWNTARFARNKALAAWTKVQLRSRGTEMVYVSQNIDTSTDEGWLLEGFFELMDEQQSRTIAKDTLRSMLKNARDGFFNGGRVPFGYIAVADGKRKRLAVEPGEAEVVKWIFRAYLDGYGVKALALQLNQTGRLRRGRKWDKNTLTNLLKNEVYIGHVVFNRVNSRTNEERHRDEWIITKSHQGIVEPEAFDEVQVMFGDRAPKIEGSSSRSHFVFSGMLQCARCGATLQTESATGRSKVYHYYNCRSAQKGTGCEHRRIPAADLDAWLINHIMDRVFTRDQIEQIIADLHAYAGRWVREREAQRASLVRELRDVEVRLSNLYEVLELQGKGAPNLGDLAERMHELRDQRSKLERHLTEIEARDAPAIQIGQGDVTDVYELLRAIVVDNPSAQKQRTFFASFITQIVVGDEECRIHYRPDKLVNLAGGPVHSGVGWLPVRGIPRTEILALRLPERFIRAA